VGEIAVSTVPTSDDPSATQDHPSRPAPSTTLSVAALASIGAGAIHATAAGAHSEHKAAVVAFVLTAAFQIGWGVVALVRPARWVSVVGVVGNTAAIGGWLIAKTSGISFVTGLDAQEDPQFADTLAAALAVVAVVGALLALSDRLVWSRRPQPGLVAVSALAAIALTVPGMVSTGSHSHAGGHSHDGTEAAGHDHSDGAATETAHDHAAGTDDHAGHDAAALPAKPYDPTQPIDLSGVEGVTPEQQAAAENLIAITLLRLPQWADPAVASAAGYKSIGDGFTGYEHLIKWDTINDQYVLDPDHPESLVYRVDRATGERTLEAAMFMLPQGETLETVPELGGKLTQWHIHNNLCFTQGDAPQVRGIAGEGQTCPRGLTKLEPVPMIHVWIVPHRCGPFAALEGVGGGQIPEGEERLCDHAHGAA
jgi:hypothetical protein